MIKVIHQNHILAFYLMVFSLIPFCADAQDYLLNKYGLWVISSFSQFQKTVKENDGKTIVDLKKVIPGIVIDLRYATKNNFMYSKLYPSIHTTWLRKTSADSLAMVQKELDSYGLGLKIFDAYRPYSITEKMWVRVKDDRYTADPKKGSGHNRGIAVDITLINLTTKKELEMGTNYDNFSDTAHYSFTGLRKEIITNRILLKMVMEKYGFRSLETEWWHFSLPNAMDFELLDIPFRNFLK